MFTVIIYILFAGFCLSRMKDEDSRMIFACFAVILGIILLASSGHRVSCDENGDCADYSQSI